MYSTFTRVAEQFVERAAQLRRWAGPSAESVARAYELAAAEIQAALEEEQDERLTLREAAATSGYSVDHIGRLIRDGTLPNAGRSNAPRIRRGDLPIKPGVRLAGEVDSRYDPLTDARTLLSRRGER